LQTVSKLGQEIAASPDFQNSFIAKLQSVDTSTLIATGAIGTAVIIAGVAVYNYKGVLVEAAGASTVTGTVWDKIPQ
jgi:hypothetical protein